VNTENNGPSWGAMHVDAPLTAEAYKVPPKNGRVEHLVPNTACLFHTVDGF
jgi:hypothetical protein